MLHDGVKNAKINIFIEKNKEIMLEVNINIPMSNIKKKIANRSSSNMNYIILTTA